MSPKVSFHLGFSSCVNAKIYVDSSISEEPFQSRLPTTAGQADNAFVISVWFLSITLFLVNNSHAAIGNVKQK